MLNWCFYISLMNNEDQKYQTKITPSKGQRLHLYSKIRQSYASNFLTSFKILSVASK